MPRIVYGVNPVRELAAARARDISVVYLADGETGPALADLRKLLAGARLAIEPRTRAELDELAGTPKHQGVVAVTGAYVYASIEDVLARAKAAGEAPLVLALDSIQDPGNFGALVRSAHVLGAHGVVVPKDRAAEVTPAVVKTSAGASEHTAIAQVVNLVRTLEQLKEEGLWVVGATAGRPGALPPWKLDLKGPIALVVGAEGKGLRPLVDKVCDLRAEIPMTGQVSSLNASAAGAVLLYEARRQRVG